MINGVDCGQPQVLSAHVNLTSETATVSLVPEQKTAPDGLKQLGEELAQHLTTCGFTSTLRGMVFFFFFFVVVQCCKCHCIWFLWSFMQYREKCQMGVFVKIGYPYICFSPQQNKWRMLEKVREYWGDFVVIWFLFMCNVCIIFSSICHLIISFIDTWNINKWEFENPSMFCGWSNFHKIACFIGFSSFQYFTPQTIPF